MSELIKEKERLENELEALNRKMAASTCAEAGCDMKHIGGRNASCKLGNDCACSVPVHSCTRCGDSDYGDNAEARDIIERCGRGEFDD